MKITVLSGGSGNTAIINGILDMYPSCDLKVIINAFDDGKSTGVCRKIVKTLGVSDVRKNHAKFYNRKSDQNYKIKEFFNNRYDIIKGKEEKFVFNKLKYFGIETEKTKKAVSEFFRLAKKQDYEFRDFNIANILYSGLWALFGYDEGNKIICDLIGIENNVILNTHDNVFIDAVCDNGFILKSEGDIVSLNNSDIKIKKIQYHKQNQKLNKEAIDRLIESDLVILSTGTFWSSLLPTIEYGGMYNILNAIKAKKIWVLNTSPDLDSIGTTSEEFYLCLKNIGLDLSSWNIISNAEAVKELQLNKAKEYFLGNISGKNDSEKVAFAIFDTYFDLPFIVDKVLIDFDGTIYDSITDNKIIKQSLDIISKNKKITIVSGNSIEPIKFLIKQLSIKNFDNYIWANANSVLYKRFKKIKTIRENKIKNKKKIIRLIRKMLPNINIISTDYCIKLKPVYNRELKRFILNCYLYDFNVKACKTGKTTIDILSVNNNKSQIFYKESLYKKNTLYIGDEINEGNDKIIADLCNYKICVNNPEEANILLKLI